MTDRSPTVAGIDLERAAAGRSEHHTSARPLPGRDRSGLLAGRTPPEALASPVYFMTEDRSPPLCEPWAP